LTFDSALSGHTPGGVRSRRSNGVDLGSAGVAQAPSAIITAPGGRIAVLHHAAGTEPSSVQLFDGETGALLSTLPLPPSTSRSMLAAGQTELFILGSYSSPFDFDPGTDTDLPSSARGVYISRYSL